MRRLLLLSILSISCQLLAAPSTPITRGRLTTDLDAAGHSITNGPLATTNFVWEALANFSGGIDENAVTSIVESVVFAATNGLPDEEYVWRVSDARAADHAEGALAAARIYADAAVSATRTNLPPLSASATVGDLVDRVNAVIGVLK